MSTQIFYRSVNIVGIALLAACLLKERLNIPQIIGVALSVIGVIMCVQPWYDHSNNDETSINTDTYRRNGNIKIFLLSFYYHESSYIHLENVNESNVTTMEPGDPEDDGFNVIFGYIFATVAGIFASFANIVLKFRLQEVPASTLNVYSGAFGATVYFITSFAMQEDLTFPTDALNIFYVLAQVSVVQLN